ncbi:MAG: acylphosphatase [Alphaproteobacteria bacterium]|nr:acylphosphatase [Alphaproteobacteria bacterium]
MEEIHFKVFGRVQQVGFRYFCVHEADKRQLSGWVRNRRGGEVEVYATGPSQGLSDFFKACQKGPCFARVDKVEVLSFPDAPMPLIENGVFRAVNTV